MPIGISFSYSHHKPGPQYRQTVIFPKSTLVKSDLVLIIHLVTWVVSTSIRADTLPRSLSETCFNRAFVNAYYNETIHGEFTCQINSKLKDVPYLQRAKYIEIQDNKSPYVTLRATLTRDFIYYGMGPDAQYAISYWECVANG
jgi:hypothetical protein